MAQRAKKIAEENSHHDCDFRDMLSRVGDKWSLLVIFILKGRPAFRGRFSDLKRSIPGISQRMLTATVRNLERDGVLTRHVYAEVPPRVEYELTPLGRGLTEPVLGLVSWLQSNWPAIRSARDRFDARKQVTGTGARPVAPERRIRRQLLTFAIELKSRPEIAAFDSPPAECDRWPMEPGAGPSPHAIPFPTSPSGARAAYFHDRGSSGIPVAARNLADSGDREQSNGRVVTRSLWALPRRPE